jgi:YVTN family beta-propeller protein
MKRIIPIVFVVVAVAGCVKSPTEPIVTPLAIPDVAGVYVLNEGNFGDATGARLSFYDPASDSVYRSVVETANDGAHLGSTADDVAMAGGKLYILMSGSEKLVVLSSHTHLVQQEAVYRGATPHSLLIDTLHSTIYITELYKNSILVVDLQSLLVVDTIAVGSNPQEMAMTNGRLFVCNSGYGADNTISVINPASHTVVATLAVGSGPSGITLASDGKLWTVCTGNAYGSPAVSGGLFLVDPVALTVTDSVMFNEPLGDRIAASRDGFVYVIGSSASYFGGPIHRITVSTKAVAEDFIAGTFYGIGVDPSNGDVYGADAKAFTAPGVVSIYASSGALNGTFVVERGPSQFLFKH